MKYHVERLHEFQSLLSIQSELRPLSCFVCRSYVHVPRGSNQNDNRRSCHTPGKSLNPWCQIDSRFRICVIESESVNHESRAFVLAGAPRVRSILAADFAATVYACHALNQILHKDRENHELKLGLYEMTCRAQPRTSINYLNSI